MNGKQLNTSHIDGFFFAVYGLDTSSYPSDEIWGYDPYLQRKRSLYGRRPGGLLRLFRPEYCNVEEAHGSLLVISGGEMSRADKGEDITPEQQEMYMSGVRPHGDHFAEQAVNSLIDPDDRVTMLRLVSRDEALDYLATIREAGFEVTETGDVTPGVGNSFALCRGTGRMLKACDWLEQVWWEPFFLHANRGPQSRLESSVLAAAVARTNPESALVQLLEQIQRQPQDAQTILGEDYVHVRLTDPHEQSLHIVRQDPDASALQGILSQAAKRADLALYDAGNLRQPDNQGHYFVEFKHWERCVPIPEHWRRVP